MKTAIFFSMALSMAFGVASTLAATITTLSSDDLPRFQLEKESLASELAAWKASEAGRFAKEQNYFLPHGASHVGTASFDEDEQLRRLFLTKQSIEQVQQLNPDAVFSTDSPFTLLTDAEFSAFVGSSFHRTNGFEPTGAAHNTSSVDPEADVMAAFVDWTTSGCVAPVKNQGQCGSCWSFAAVASLESAFCLAGHSLQTFSEQQVLSCDTSSYGCNGGFPGNGLTYLQQNGGICTEDGYPYASGESGDAGSCDTSSCEPQSVSIKQVVTVGQSEAALVSALQGRPVAVGVAAGNNTWKQYKGGVVSSCASRDLDHAVLAVGFTSDAFKIKNSWGTSWGESGYIRLKRKGGGSTGVCGVIGPKSVYPTL